MEPIRILHIVGIMNRGGLETLIMNIYRNIDRDKVQFDFLVHSDMQGVFEEEIIKLGGTIYRISHVSKVGPMKYKKELNKFFKSNQQYKIVHSHMNTISGIILREAKKCGIKIRISHSHNAYPKMNLIESIYKNYSKLFINNNSTYKFACSKLAGSWLYGKKYENDVKIINNGVNINKFKYNPDVNGWKRKELNIDKNSFVVGHIASFTLQKNHDFLIDIFKEIKNQNDNAILLLVGDGVLKKSIRNKVRELGLVDNVIFLGIRDDIEQLIQVFDIMVFPSFHEGLPVTLIEAQASGLKCIISDNITKEVDMNIDLLKFLSLEKSARYWAEQSLNYIKGYDRNSCGNIKEEYNIEKVSRDIEQFYIENIMNVR